jgi:ubiquinone/menaquinone biosynthesis C-methylase UbiE
MRRPSFIARQASRPTGWIGRLLLRVMGRETARFNAEVLDAVSPRDGEHVLEIGFGHGRTLAAAGARAPGATFAGIDVAPTAAAVATRRCRSLIAAGRLELMSGDAAVMPWGSGTFDAVFSVHTLYFWREPAAPLAEARRILRPGGRIVLGVRETSKAAISRFPPPTYRFYSNEDAAALLATAGFVDISVQPAVSGAELRIVVASAPC